MSPDHLFTPNSSESWSIERPHRPQGDHSLRILPAYPCPYNIHQHIHSLRIKRHNKAVGEIRKLLISSEKSRCFTLMNVGTFNNNPQENTVPNWLLSCTCSTQRCHCNTRFRPDILYVKGLPYQNAPPQRCRP